MLYLVIAYCLVTGKRQTELYSQRETEYVIQMTQRNNNNKKQRTSCCGGFSNGISSRRKAKTVIIQS